MAIKISKNRLDMGSTPIKNVSYQDLDQVATQAAPAASKTRLYSKTDGALYVVPAAGSETAAGVPANGIIHTTATSAPTGWAEYTAGRGRVIAGTPASGTHGGTVGSALTDLQDPTHTHTGPSHGHNQNSAAVSNAAAGGQVWASGADNSAMDQGTGVTSAYRMYSGVVAAGTGATGATSATMPYIQQLGIIKS